MAYEVLARKFRPQRFEEVVGQDHIVKTLRNAIEQNRIAQGYLLSGPRGTGKTTLARIFAKALNCKDGPTVTPCGVCDSCVSIAAGASLEVTEIDGASNNKVDDVHSKIIDTIDFAPMSGKFRIYYIDEVHMLTTSAFNALLKTLEEPPPYAKFIFATTEPEKVLGTILSRCQRFDLRRIAIPAIVGQLQKIATEERINIEEDALLAIARGADGGMRDAESAFDQMIAFTGNEIRESDVLNVFGLASRTTIEQLAAAILTGDVASVLTLIDELDQSGKDLRRLTAELIAHFRNLLVCMQLKGATTSLDLTDAQSATIQSQAELCSTSAVLTVVENLIDLESRMKLSLSQRTMVETTLIRCARASHLVDLEKILQKLTKLSESGALAAAMPAQIASTASSATPVAAPISQATPAPQAAAPSAPSVQPAPATRRTSEAELNAQIIETPVVREALEAFNAEVTNIEHKK